VQCTQVAMFIMVLYVTGMILYLFFNFEELLENLELDIDEIRQRPQ